MKTRTKLIEFKLIHANPVSFWGITQLQINQFQTAESQTMVIKYKSDQVLETESD